MLKQLTRLISSLRGSEGHNCSVAQHKVSCNAALAEVYIAYYRVLFYPRMANRREESLSPTAAMGRTS